MPELTMITVTVLLGLTMVGLTAQILNQIRLMRLMDRMILLENRILARFLMEENQMKGTTVTLEDLILRDLEEMDLTTMTNTMTDPKTPTKEKESLRENHKGVFPK